MILPTTKSWTISMSRALAMAATAFVIGCGAKEAGNAVTLDPRPEPNDTNGLPPAAPGDSEDPPVVEDPDTVPDPGEVSVVPLPIDPSGADELAFQAALTEYDAANFSEAEQLFIEFTQSYSSSPRVDNAEYLAGRSAYALGIAPVGSVDDAALQRATTAFNAVLNQYPESPFVSGSHYYLGRTHFTRAALDQALPEFQASLLDPASTFADNAQYYVGRTHFELGQLDLAESALRTLVVTYPDSSYLDNGTFYLGRTLFDLQRYAEALGPLGDVAGFDTSIFLDNALYYHGRSNYSLGDLASALIDFESLLSTHATSGYRDNALHYRARIQTDQANCTAAAQTLSELELAFPTSSYVTSTRDYLTQGGC